MSWASFSESKLIVMNDFEFFEKIKKSSIHYYLKDFLRFWSHRSPTPPHEAIRSYLVFSLLPVHGSMLSCLLAFYADNTLHHLYVFQADSRFVSDHVFQRLQVIEIIADGVKDHYIIHT